MKYYIGLLTLATVAIAAPVEVEHSESAAFTSNLTLAAERLVGFAGFGGGTQGGAGGTSWTVWDAFALRSALDSNEPRIITVRGRIDLTALFTGSPGVRLNVGSRTSLLGHSDRSARIVGGGLRVNHNVQVIFRNIAFENALSYAHGEQPNGNGGIVSMVPGAFSEIDAIEITTAEFVWVDHCEFSDDPWNAASIPEHQRRHDGMIDIVRGASWVTISNNIFRNHNMLTLVGNSDSNGAQDNGRLKVTFFANWFRGTVQRNPLVRFGEVHVLNNLYTDIISYGIGVHVAAKVFAERNVFINCRRAWGWASGVPNPIGFLHNEVNALQNSGFDSGISNSGVTWRPWQYYQYNAIAIGNVEQHVRRLAGTI